MTGEQVPTADTERDFAVLSRLIDRRVTCRAYKPDPVPRAIIERILEVSQRAPSWCNVQPWELIITEGEATRKFADAIFAHVTSGEATPNSDIPFPAAYVGIYDQRRKGVGKQLYETLGIAKGDREGSRRQTLENFRLFGAPHTAIVTTDRNLGAYGAVDSGLYLGYFTLCAQSLGVATTAQAALAMYGDFVRDYFKIPEDRQILCGISFGWPDDAHPVNNFRTTRADIASVAQFRSE